MQAGAQILMEQKNRGRTLLCAASHRLHTLLKMALHGQAFFLNPPYSFHICPFLPSAAAGPRRGKGGQ